MAGLSRFPRFTYSYISKSYKFKLCISKLLCEEHQVLKSSPQTLSPPPRLIRPILLPPSPQHTCSPSPRPPQPYKRLSLSSLPPTPGHTAAHPKADSNRPPKTSIPPTLPLYSALSYTQAACLYILCPTVFSLRFAINYKLGLGSNKALSELQR